MNPVHGVELVLIAPLARCSSARDFAGGKSFVVRFIETCQLFDPEFIRMEISVTEPKQYWEREENGEKS